MKDLSGREGEAALFYNLKAGGIGGVLDIESRRVIQFITIVENTSKEVTDNLFELEEEMYRTFPELLFEFVIVDR